MAFIVRTGGVLPIKNTSTALIASNQILLYGQASWETDTYRSKVGDGVSVYTDLTYAEWGYAIVSAAGTNTYTGIFSKPFFIAYFDMLRIRVKFTNANTGASTINLNSLGAKSITRLGAAIIANDIRAGSIHDLYYDGTNFQMKAA